MEFAPGGYVEMSQDEIEFDLLSEAEGTIEAGDGQRERLDELTERLKTDEFHIATPDRIVYGCIDGRPGAAPKPNSAGGTETLMVMDDLVNQQFRGNDGSTLSAYRNVTSFLKKNGHPVGGHDDDHASGDGSGCGANDKLPAIYEMLVRKGEYIRALATEYGINVDTKTHEIIMANAAARTEFSTGASLKAELDSATGGEYDHVYGAHKEVVVVLNTRFGTTLDRAAIADAFGENYQAFNVDVWALAESANVISTTPDSVESHRKEVAGAYYNFATALTLCGPDMRVIVLS